MKSLLSLSTPSETQQKAADWCRRTRKLKGYNSRKALSLATSIPEATIKYFENTGNISLGKFLIIFTTIGDLDEFDNLFKDQKIPPKSMGEILSV